MESCMRRHCIVLLIVLAVAGCDADKRRERSFAASAPAPAAQAARYMAYEHYLTLDVTEDRVAEVHKSLEATCLQATAHECVVLGSQLSTGRHVSAELRVRAKPEGIRALIESVSAQGEVISQSVTAEDLAEPIADTETKLAMLNDYRAKLQTLSDRARGDVDALIKVSKELADVQSQIEMLAGTRANMFRRVETQLLTVSISSGSQPSFWRPIADALAEFGITLSSAIAALVRMVAYLLPFSVLLVGLGWAVLKLRARRKRAVQGS
jgi:hypothetical protein